LTSSNHMLGIGANINKYSFDKTGDKINEINKKIGPMYNCK